MKLFQLVPAPAPSPIAITQPISRADKRTMVLPPHNISTPTTSMVDPKTPFGVRSGLLLSGIGSTSTSSSRRPPAAEAAADLPTYLSAHHAANVSRILDATRLSAERSANAIVRARLEQDWLAERMRMLGPGPGSGSGSGSDAGAAAASAAGSGGGGGGGGSAGEFAVIGMHASRYMQRDM